MFAVIEIQYFVFFQKRDMQKESLDQRQDFIQDQRKKTIDRLKTYKVVSIGFSPVY